MQIVKIAWALMNGKKLDAAGVSAILLLAMGRVGVEIPQEASVQIAAVALAVLALLHKLYKWKKTGKYPA